MVRFDDLIRKAESAAGATVAVASAEDHEVLKAVAMAVEKQLASFILVGDEGKIGTMMQESFPALDQRAVKIHHADSAQSAALEAVRLVSSGAAGVLMKGHLETSVLLKAVLNKEVGLRTGNVLSHVALFEVPSIKRSIFVTDAAMNIAPDLTQKVQIIQNAVKIAHGAGVENPSVAPLAAVETVNPAMQATLDAAALTQMNRRGQIKGCVVDGPLALDNAVSESAAAHKGVTGPAAGQADILLVPSIEAGNILYKSLMYFGNSKVGAVISGAKAPIVLTSRADSAESKLYSLALAICTSY
ncbi:phosphate butyryltransferase [Jeotgalibacillus haloalkalitolerans]|uniref:Phosphate butyryltransferase n=1 Tax=Jeotgalibacillus haloalkalitolerans TaxID=3104292 RepID=A0ABU5KLT6_9BACL|nr:phosphate butyryltransferase [Jeotgalibacillus sp. HH7-29]MDZ5712109.1 phosphate butyryltransferase [Jeotgalibacillus sp. HH7-29]